MTRFDKTGGEWLRRQSQEYQQYEIMRIEAASRNRDEERKEAGRVTLAKIKQQTIDRVGNNPAAAREVVENLLVEKTYNPSVDNANIRLAKLIDLEKNREKIEAAQAKKATAAYESSIARDLDSMGTRVYNPRPNMTTEARQRILDEQIEKSNEVLRRSEEVTLRNG